MTKCYGAHCWEVSGTPPTRACLNWRWSSEHLTFCSLAPPVGILILPALCSLILPLEPTTLTAPASGVQPAVVNPTSPESLGRRKGVDLGMLLIANDLGTVPTLPGAQAPPIETQEATWSPLSPDDEPHPTRGPESLGLPV